MLIPNCECKLVDEKGDEVGEGSPGELCVRGPNVCLGYWRNEEATKDAISSDGWLKTGDVAVTRNNRFWIVDRKKVRSTGSWALVILTPRRSLSKLEASR